MTHIPPLPPTPAGADSKFISLSRAKRCLSCFYVLEHLSSKFCPECGRSFNPDDPSTYTVKPPFVWWRYWLPGFCLTVGLGLVAYALLIPLTGFGWSVTLAIPVMIGGTIGYSVRLGRRAIKVAASIAFLACLTGLIFAGAAGVFCALILIVMAVVPLGISLWAGLCLRLLLKDSNWSQRHWLPVFLLFLLPLMVGAVELCQPRTPDVTVQTIRIIDAPLPAAWDGVMFYEEVTHDPPWLLRLGLRTPLRTVGRTDHIGDRKTCIYSRGHLTKQVTAREPLKSLEFAVVEQDMFEDYSVRLKEGSFQFSAIDATHTRVLLTTRYEPLLHPRFAWQPVEEHVVRLLHEHVLEGMARKAERKGRTHAAANTPSDSVEEQ